MTERQKRLVKEFGPSFYKRNKSIQNEFLYLAADACSVLTEAEWRECSNAIEKVISELQRTQRIVNDRIKEAGTPVE